MPHRETPDELAEHLATLLGVYGAAEDHKDDCECRVCFVSDMTARIRESVKNEALFNQLDQAILLQKL